MPSKSTTIVNVNRQRVKHNKDTGAKDLPVYSVHVPNIGIRYAYDVEMAGTVKGCNEPASPLDCGATVWMEVTGEVRLYNENGDLFDGYLFADGKRHARTLDGCGV